jgi:hypothetical protein
MSDMRVMAPQEDAETGSAPRVVDLRIWKELGIHAAYRELPETSTGEPGSAGRPSTVDQGQEVNKSYFLVELEHKKPLPKDIAEIAGQRIYGWLYSQGVEAGVRVKPIEQLMDKPEWEQE